MTDANIIDVKFGLHTDVYDLTSTPATVSTIELLRGLEGLMPRSRIPLDRDLHSIDGGRYASFHGTKDISPIPLGMHFRGVSGNAGAFTPQTTMEQCRMLDSFFGAAAAAIAGAAPTAVTAGSGGSVVVVSSAAIANGDIILIPTSVGNFAREVVSGGGTTTLTVDRDVPITITNGGTIVRAARWDLSTALAQHVAGYLRAESDTWRRDYFGCVPDSFDLVCAEQRYVEMNMNFLPNDWTDVAEVNPTYTAPTAGSPIVVADSPFFIGSTEFLIHNLKISGKQVVTPRGATTGANGVNGFTVRKKHDFMISGALYVGDNVGALHELVDDSGTPSIDNLTGDSAAAGAARTMRDISAQLGTAAGAFALVRIPAADIRGKVQDVDGYPMFVFDAYATRPTSGSAFRLGVG